MLKSHEFEVFYLRQLVNNLPEFMFWKDRNSVFLGCNNNFASLAGLDSPADIIGKTDYDLPWSKAESDAYRADDREVIQSGKGKYNIEESQTNSLGERTTLLTNKTPLYDQHGDIAGVIGIYANITELKNIQRRLAEEKERAEAASRAKTQFLANMSHDMLSPLSGILLAAQAINDDKEFPEQVEELSRIILLAGNQLKRFFTSCLDLSKLEMEEWVSTKSIFSLRRLVQDIYDLYLPKAMGVGLSLSIVCDPNLSEAVEGHHDSLYRALLNLVGNALKFTERGSVTLRAFCGEKIDAERSMMVFQVEDTGIGIPEDKFKVIFEKLQRLTPSYSSNIEGSGIGLYIVDQFIERMGGTIQVQSEVGKGSIFTVLVPMRIADATEKLGPVQIQKPAQKIAEPVVTVEKQGPWILLVEDVPIIQMATKSLLNSAGFEVDVAASGKEALDLFASKTYGLIYMDIGLPDMLGHEVALRIREQEKAAGKAATPIIALTGHGATDVQAFCGCSGIQGVVSKPLSREQAEALWQYYVNQDAVTIPHFTMLDDGPEQALVLDFTATVVVLGSEEKAKKTMKAFADEFEVGYLPKIARLVEKNDRAGLRFLLHQLIGCLTYVIFPPLQAAVVYLHDLVPHEAESIEEAYQKVVMEMNKAITFVRR